MLIQFSLPRCVTTEVLDKQNQLALYPLESSDASNLSSALFEEDEVLVEDWVSDSYSEEAVQPLDIEPIAFSLPVAMAEQSPVDVESFKSVDLQRVRNLILIGFKRDSIISIASLACPLRVWKIKQ